jgi:UDP-N-acetylglucosamine transferase subunit ALG13
MILLTVGTQFPFDRLVTAVDEACRRGFPEQVFAQIGESTYRPQSFPAVGALDKHQFDDYCRRASAIIGHAGMGTIGMALELGKPLLVLPRRKKFREVVNDHQVAIARKFEELGHVLVAYEAGEVADRMNLLRTFVPRPRHTSPEAVAGRIAGFLGGLAAKRGGIAGG